MKITDETNGTKYRAILAEYQTTHNATSTNKGILPTAFEYKNSSNEENAARLATAQEIMRGCGLNQTGNYTTGELSNCQFLFEETGYSSSAYRTNLWLETPFASYNSIWVIDSYGSRLNGQSPWVNNTVSIHPTIDVPKNKLSAN